MGNKLWSMVEWVIAASAAGFVISAMFAEWLRFSRHRFLIPYVSLVTIFLYCFIVLNEIDFATFITGNWAWGILAGGLVSIFLVKPVRPQPVSRQSSRTALFFDITWTGLAYGITDALFLNVMPVVVWFGTSHFNGATSLLGQICVGAAGLFASILVTLTYHLGYPEFRNKKVSMVLAGNISLRSLFSSAVVLWGALSAIQPCVLLLCCQGPKQQFNFLHIIKAKLRRNEENDKDSSRKPGMKLSSKICIHRHEGSRTLPAGDSLPSWLPPIFLSSKMILWSMS